MRFNHVIRQATYVFMASTLLAGCATRSENIEATYQSPMQYQSHDCDQIQMEMVRVSSKVREISGAQDSEATKDAVALGVGLVIFWPALFFMMGDDKEADIGRLKGEYDALHQAAIMKKCGFSEELENKPQPEKNPQPDTSDMI